MTVSAMKSRSGKRWTRLLCSTALASGLLLAASPRADANPDGGQVVGGAATISQAPGTTTIDQSSNKAVIDWKSFSIAKGELTKFNQPGADAIALNRVRGGQRSDIFGRLEANGQVWLVNPNGVLIGPDARINVGGFLATTADILNTDFMAGRYDFSIPSPNPDAAIVNQGTISVKESGLAALVAPHVRNEGVIEGNLAQVVVAGAPTFAVDFYGDGLIRFEATSQVVSAADPSQPLVENTGVIRAPGGHVLLTASAAEGVVDQVIDTTGVIEARSFAMKNGEIVLDGGGHGGVAVAGTLDAAGDDAGETGGTVKVLGEMVALNDGTLIDVSGDVGGGTALVGGNYRGKGPERNATRTFVAKGATVTADARTRGDGGTVVAWASDETIVHGTLSARGGSAGGNGGLIETSARNLLVSGVPDASAPKGVAGTWLLNPFDYTIVTGTASDPGKIGADQINAALNGGTSVTIDTADDNGSPGSGDVTQAWGATISKTSGSEVTFSIVAANDISLEDSITSSSGKLNVNIYGDSDNSGQGAVYLAGDIRTSGGDLTVRGANSNSYSINSGYGIYAPISTIDTGGGAISMTGSSTSTTGHGAGIHLGGDVRSGGGDIVMTASALEDGIFLKYASLDSGGGDIVLTALGTTKLTVGEVNSGAGRIKMTADKIRLKGGSESVQGQGDLTLQPSTLSEQLFVGGNGTDDFLPGDSIAALKGGFHSITIGSKNSTGGLTVEPVSPDYLAFSDPVRLLTAGELVLNRGISSDAAGDAIALLTSHFVNNAGAKALKTGSAGRFLVYSVDPANDQTGGLTGQQIDSTFDSLPPDSPLLPVGGNYFIYSLGPSSPPPPPPLAPPPSEPTESALAFVVPPPVPFQASGEPERLQVPPTVYNPTLTVPGGPIGTSSSAETSAQSVVAFAPAQSQLLPQAQQALDETTADPLYANDGNRDLWGLTTFPTAAGPMAAGDVSSARQGDER